MKRFHSISLLIALCGTALPAVAQSPAVATDTVATDLEEVVVTNPRTLMRPIGRVENSTVITAGELRRAACCNLGESFTTNPSVDVSYNDAATGTRQIKLLGLSGSYVQMLTENYPNLRGVAAPYGLGYIAGPWMQSIQVSKGASSVKTGYESVSGQINIEMLKPFAEEQFGLNGYVDHRGRVEGNANGNLHITPRLSTGLLLHYENALAAHDDNNDGFADLPQVRQYAGMNRWSYQGEEYKFQAGVKFLDETRRSGQNVAHGGGGVADGRHPYLINIDTRRWEVFTKNAYLFNDDADSNIALIVSGSLHDQNAEYGHKLYDVTQKNLYASLMYERKLGNWHSLSTGLSYTHDNYDQLARFTNLSGDAAQRSREIENVGGAYAQYSLNVDTKWLVMAGLRYDYSSMVGAMVTPRFHVKWNPNDAWSMHASAGRGYRTPHILAEYNYLLASSRAIVITPDVQGERAWNTGGGFTLTLPVWERNLSLSAEYYFTDFSRQLIVDLDSNPHAAIFKNLMGKSRSHTIQTELTWDVLDDLTLTASYRYNDVKVDYGQGLVAKPLTSRSKSLLTLAYSPMMKIWQFDATLAVNGGGRMPTPYALEDGSMSWAPEFKPFAQLSAQITRNFRRWAVYVGGENLTNYHQPAAIIDAGNPWGPNFDGTMVYGPLHGITIYAGFRYTLKSKKINKR